MTRKILFMLISTFWFGISTFHCHAVAGASARITVKVVDEYERKVAGAKLSVRFSSDEYPIIAQTENDGFTTLTSTSNDGVIVGEVSKDNYYPSIFHSDFFIKKFGRWQPWNKGFTVVLRPIVNPVPMYVRNRFFEIPIHGKEIGFDLMKADWVIPHGQGTQSDFIFRIDRRYKDIDEFEATMTLTFPNPHDGIQVVKDDRGGDFSVGSIFRLPRTAPEEGYQAKLVKRISRGSAGKHTDRAEDNNFIFRVRSEVDKQGKLKQAMYGKILGDIKFAPIGSLNSNEGLGAIGMHYYLNPDYTRNLEFDPKRNLFISLPKVEGVRLP
jgi:hypothetical protein